jgi:hypothetical protein
MADTNTLYVVAANVIHGCMHASHRLVSPIVEAPQELRVCKPVSAAARAVVHIVPPSQLRVRVRTALFRFFHCACIACSLTRRTCGVLVVRMSVDVSPRDAACEQEVHVDTTAWNQRHHTTTANEPGRDRRIPRLCFHPSSAAITLFRIWRTIVGSE